MEEYGRIWKNVEEWKIKKYIKIPIWVIVTFVFGDERNLDATYDPPGMINQHLLWLHTAPTFSYGSKIFKEINNLNKCMV